MIRLHPILHIQHDHACPYCQAHLEKRDWYIPGMRNLIDLICPRCHRDFYGDLPAGHGLQYPMLLDQGTGAVHNQRQAPWFAELLRTSYSNRHAVPIGITIEQKRPLHRPLLLNCLDALYGHCVLKLLNAQYYLDRQPEMDLIVLVPRFLRWMVPDGVAGIWTVDLPLIRGADWNDWLAAELKRLIEPMDECWLSVAFSHPHPEDYSIERFTRVCPFPIDQWHERLERPTVTFVWREDRIWSSPGAPTGWRRATRQLLVRRGLHQQSVEEQARRVVALARALHQAFPPLDFAVAGLGVPGNLPRWVSDLRRTEIDGDVERAWCERYARSHVVIGVHGSNMLLPSGHAGAAVELVPDGRWGNLVQDILTSARDGQELLFRYRFLPLVTSPVILGTVTASLISDLPYVLLNFSRPWNDHLAVHIDPLCIARTRRNIMVARSLRP